MCKSLRYWPSLLQGESYDVSHCRRLCLQSHSCTDARGFTLSPTFSSAMSLLSCHFPGSLFSYVFHHPQGPHKGLGIINSRLTCLPHALAQGTISKITLTFTSDQTWDFICWPAQPEKQTRNTVLGFTVTVKVLPQHIISKYHWHR